MSHFTPLRSELEQYLEPNQIALIHRAYLCAERAHAGQKRRTGEPYVSHPVAVCRILASLRMDPESIIAGLLHDVLEDTSITKANLTEQFGREVAELVDGVSKLTQIEFNSRAEAQAENFLKMVLAMARDFRVILIKLSDRLHNMRTLSALPNEKKQRIAKETIEIYAPIANRLGMHNFYIEFEDLSFQTLYPHRYQVLSESVKKARGNRKKVISTIEKALKSSLTRASISFEKIWGREKHLYSIYKKMRSKHVSFSQIMDVYAFRIVVENKDTCYRVLGAVHGLYKPVPDRFKDYIAIPKANGYQALHTTLFGPFGVPIEIQIRSQTMDQMAANGIAAHWLYKTSAEMTSSAKKRAQGWLQDLLDLQESTGSSLEFIENVKIDLFPDEIYVFTPKGTILEFPRGATPVDFAYAIHSDIGNSCVAAKIDRQLAPLSTVLSNGQTVEIITAPKVRPNPAWLGFVVTGKARSNIRNNLKKQKHDESVSLGKRLLKLALGKSLRRAANKKRIRAVLEQYNYRNTHELYENLGLGNHVPLIIAQQMLEVSGSPELELSEQGTIFIKGTEGVVIQFAECCRPIPGDPIVGATRSGQGLEIHVEQCKKIANFREDSRRCVEVRWEENLNQEFKVDLIIEIANRRGALGILANAVAHAEANIDNLSVIEREEKYFTFCMTVVVIDRDHLARVLRRIEAIKDVVKVERRKVV